MTGTPNPAADPSARPPALTDTRLIEFGPAAVRAAAESVGVTLLGLPAGRRVRAVGFDPPGNAVRLGYEPAAGSGPEAERLLPASGLAALLIAYCIAVRIPIARDADKKLTVTPSGVSLRFVTRRANPPRP